MRKQNSLFHFVIQGHALNHARFERKTNIENTQYLLYSLSPEPNTSVTGQHGEKCKLTGHHLSIYEQHDDNDANVSQYHYTAYLQDGQGVHYQLHVYFNSADEVVKTVLADRDAQNPGQAVTGELDGAFAQMAIDRSRSIISTLRAEYQIKITDYEKRYAILERELGGLSVDLGANRDRYLDTLNRTIELLSEITSFHDEYYYRACLRFHNKLQQSLVAAAPEVKHDETVETEIVEAESGTETTVRHHSRKSVHERPSLKPLIKSADEARSEYEAVVKDKQSYQDQQQKLLAFYNKSRELMLFAEVNDYRATQEDLRAAHLLVVSATSAIKNLLPRLLLQNEFALAKPFMHLLNPVPNNLLMLALRRDNAPLLGFLLENGRVPLNTTKVDGDLTLVEYCYRAHSPATPKVACLSMLIEKGASVLTKLADGLSIAHHILTTPGHGLRKALTSHAQKIVNNRNFYKTLIQDIEQQLASGDVVMSVESRQQLQAVAGYYRGALDKLMAIAPNTIVGGDRIMQQAENFFSEIDETFSPETRNGLHALATDPEILARQEQYSIVVGLYLSKLTPREKQQVLSGGTRLLTDIKWIFEDMDLSGGDAKERTLKALDAFSKIVVLRTSLLDLNREAKSRLTRKQASKINSERARIQKELSSYDEYQNLLFSGGSAKACSLIEDMVQSVGVISRTFSAMQDSTVKIMEQFAEDVRNGKPNASEDLIAAMRRNYESLFLEVGRDRVEQTESSAAASASASSSAAASMQSPKRR